MPLFKKNHDELPGNNSSAYDNNSNVGNQRTSGGQHALGSGPDGGLGTHQHHQQDPLYPSPNVQTTAQVPGAGQYDNNINNNNSRGGYGAQPGMGTMTGAMGQGANAHSGMGLQRDAAGNEVNTSQTTGGGGGAKRMEGKVERVIGSMIGSESLKAKGLAKEQEAAEIKLQASELSEAERLEQGALARRERAVAHGAHPDHLHLGDRNPGAGASSVNELGGGAGIGINGAGGAGSAARGGY